MWWFMAIACAGCWGGAGLILGQIWQGPNSKSEPDPINLVLGVALFATFGIALVIAIGHRSLG